MYIPVHSSTASAMLPWEHFVCVRSLKPLESADICCRKVADFAKPYRYAEVPSVRSGTIPMRFFRVQGERGQIGAESGFGRSRANLGGHRTICGRKSLHALLSKADRHWPELSRDWPGFDAIGMPELARSWPISAWNQLISFAQKSTARAPNLTKLGANSPGFCHTVSRFGPG